MAVYTKCFTGGEVVDKTLDVVVYLLMSGNMHNPVADNSSEFNAPIEKGQQAGGLANGLFRRKMILGDGGQITNDDLNWGGDWKENDDNGGERLTDRHTNRPRGQRK